MSTFSLQNRIRSCRTEGAQ